MLASTEMKVTNPFQREGPGFVTGALMGDCKATAQYAARVTRPDYKTIFFTASGDEMKSEWQWDLEKHYGCQSCMNATVAK